MTKNIAQFLVDAAKHNGNEAELHEGYSFIWGQETCGVIVDSVPQLMTDLLQYIKDAPEETERLKEFDLTTFAWDNIGWRIILY